MITILDPISLLTIAFAAFYWAYVTIHTSGPYSVFTRLRARAGVQEQTWDSDEGEWIPCQAKGMAYLFCCIHCAAIWWTVGLGIVWILGGALFVQASAAAGVVSAVYRAGER